MAYDNRIFRGSRDAIGAPGDPPAVAAADDNTMVSLLKGLYSLLSNPLQTSTPEGGATEDKQDDQIVLQTAASASLAIIEDWDESDRAKVNIIAGQSGVAAGSGTNGATVPRVTVATDDALHSKLGEVQTTPTTNTVLGRLKDLLTGIVLAAGTNLIGRAVADASASTGGIASTSRILSAAASTNATSAKASAGRVYAVHGYNAATAVRYLKLYNKASAPTVGTDTPVKTLALPPGCGFAFDWPHGYSFSTGVGFALTTGYADNDTGALTSGDVLGLNVDFV